MKLLLTFLILFTAISSWAQSFLPQNSGVSSQLNAVSFSSPSTGIVVGNSGVIRKTSDSGLTWTASSSGTSADLLDVAFVNASTYFAVGESGTMIKTTNSGASWSIVNSGTTNNLTGIYVNGLNIYVTGSNGTILVSTNSGNAWTPINTGTSFTLNKVYFVSEFVGYAVGDGGTILKSFNGGQVWNFQTSGTSSYSLTDVYFIDDNVGVITGGKSSSNEAIILRTVNAGSLWTSDNLSNVYLSALGFYDQSIGFAVGGSITGNTSTILKTTSQGASWSPLATSSSRQLGACCASTTVAYTCGLNGTILRYTTSTAGIDEPESSGIQISPNPGKGIFQLTSEPEGDFSVEVFSPAGEQITIIRQSNTIDLSNYPPGIYLAVIRSESSVIMRKLVKE